MNPDPLTHFMEYIRIRAEIEPTEALQAWSTRFTEFRRQGRYDLCARLLQSIKGCPLPLHGRALVRYSEGWLDDRMGRWRDAIAAYEASMRLFHEAAIPVADVELWCNIGSIYQDQGHFTAAADSYERALQAADTLTDRRGRAGTLNNLGGLRILQGQDDAARASLDEALTIFEEVNDRYNYAAALANLAIVFRNQGRWNDALQRFVEAASIYSDLNEVQAVASTLANIALLYQYAGKLDESMLQYEQALHLFMSVGDQPSIVKTLGNLALISQKNGELEKAIEYFEQALAGYRDLGDVHGEALILVDMARLYASIGDSRREESCSSRARALIDLHGFADQRKRLEEIPALYQPPRESKPCNDS